MFRGMPCPSAACSRPLAFPMDWRRGTTRTRGIPCPGTTMRGYKPWRLRHDAAHNFVPRIERMDVQPLDIAPDIETTASNLALEHGDRFRDQGLWAEAAE